MLLHWIINNDKRTGFFMIRILLILGLSLLFGSAVCAQANKRVSLIVHYSVEDSSDDLERFVRLEFLNGKLVSQREIFTVDNDRSGPFYSLFADRKMKKLMI